MEAILAGLGQSVSSAVGSAGTAFGVSPEMMKALGAGGNEAEAAMKQAQAGAATPQGITPAQRRPVQMQDILAALQNRTTLGT